jgi:hypothetical protein
MQDVQHGKWPSPSCQLNFSNVSIRLLSTKPCSLLCLHRNSFRAHSRLCTPPSKWVPPAYFPDSTRRNHPCQIDSGLSRELKSMPPRARPAWVGDQLTAQLSGIKFEACVIGLQSPTTQLTPYRPY